MKTISNGTIAPGSGRLPDKLRQLHSLLKRAPLALKPRGPAAEEPGGPIAYLAGIATAGNLVSLILQFGSGLLVARLLTPGDLGRFNSLILITTYSIIVQAGIINGLNRELPYYLGRGSRETALALSSTALGWGILCGAVAGSLSLAWSARQLYLGNGQLAAGGAALTVVVACSFPKLYLQATMRTASEFARLAACQAVVSVCSLCLVILVWQLKYYGLCARTVVSGIIELSLLWWWRPL